MDDLDFLGVENCDFKPEAAIPTTTTSTTSTTTKASTTPAPTEPPGRKCLSSEKFSHGMILLSIFMLIPDGHLSPFFIWNF